MLHTARARAFARMGEVQRTRSTVGAADDVFAHASSEKVHPGWPTTTPHSTAGDTAHALYGLALRGPDPTLAVHRLTAAVEGRGDRYAWSCVLSRAKIASLHMATGGPNQAAAIGHQVLSEAGTLRSRRANAEGLGGLAPEPRIRAGVTPLVV